MLQLVSNGNRARVSWGKGHGTFEAPVTNFLVDILETINNHAFDLENRRKDNQNSQKRNYLLSMPYKIKGHDPA